jgi:hypothetical protein
MSEIDQIEKFAGSGHDHIARGAIGRCSKLCIDRRVGELIALDIVDVDLTTTWSASRARARNAA